MKLSVKGDNQRKNVNQSVMQPLVGRVWYVKPRSACYGGVYSPATASPLNMPVIESDIEYRPPGPKPQEN